MAIIIEMTDEREFNAILAGLTLLAKSLETGTVAPNDGDIGDILTCSGKCPPLSAEEIGEMCEAMLFPGPVQSPYKKGDKITYRSGHGLLFSAIVQHAHRDGSVTVQVYFALDEDGQEMPGTMQGDIHRITERNIVKGVPA